MLPLVSQLPINQTGALYIGMTLKWDYEQQHVDVFMPGYVDCALVRFKVTLPMSPQHSPHVCAHIHYGAHTQLIDPVDTITLLDATGIREVYEIIAVLLYYAHVLSTASSW